VDQNVLTRASSELTMHEASAIADNTLEYTVRSLLSALKTPEVLKVTRGEFSVVDLRFCFIALGFES
jgi:hypothetical protein